jgi:RimJ/RimL family protein N-acetyltransferase
MTHAPRIETERMILRGHTMDDLAARIAMTGNEETMRFIGGVQNREENAFRILRYAGKWALLGRGPFVMEEKGTGRYLGEVGLSSFFRDLGERFDEEPEASWVLAGDAHGQCYATEAMRAVIGWHDGRFGPKRLVCIIAPDNGASLALAAKLGFRAFDERSYKDHPVILFERLP